MRNVIAGPSVIGAGAVLMLVAGSASADGLSNVSTNGVNIAYFSLNQADCTLTKSTTDPGEPGRTAIVQGMNTPCVDATNPGPGGNIELGDVDSTVWATPSTMSGDLPFGSLTLSSLTLTDWNSDVGGLSLAEQYISDAILANCGAPIPPPLLGPSVACFLSGAIADCGVLISPPPAERASDPNVSYVNSDGNLVTIGLAGAENAVDLLPPTFVCPNTGTKPDPLRLSEVVKFEADWATTSPQYLYSFNAAPSGTVVDDPTESYDAIYEVKVDVPPVAAIDIEKATNGEDADTPPGPTITVGSTVTWTYRVENTGNLLLTDVTVTDNQLANDTDIDCGEGTDNVIADLDPAEVVTCTATGTASLGQYANTGSVTATDPDSFPVTDSDDSHYFGAGSSPTPVPAIQPFGLALLSFGLMIAAGWARRRHR